ncbi:hypothetical protein [Nocardia crassostreae]|uniref:hypothetical protein n=1 Tax=Nocardia crassostreae TaxID=53428 RepID=UPI0012FA1964|nr:hypothetical protein [Nocardia crassostreae]
MRDAKRDWWMPPAISTALMAVVFLVAFVMWVWHSAAVDMCPGEDRCPEAEARVDTAGDLLFAALLVTVFQWTVAYVSPRWLRIILALTPFVLGVAAITVLLTA